MTAFSPCPFRGGLNAGGMHPHLNSCPWQLGKLDVECAACGRREAASARCSGCFRVHEPAEFFGHDPKRGTQVCGGAEPDRTIPREWVEEPPAYRVKAIESPEPTNEALGLWETVNG
jgi:hypothetical protein